MPFNCCFSGGLTPAPQFGAGEHYEVRTRLGSGVKGELWLAGDRSSEERASVALKCFEISKGTSDCSSCRRGPSCHSAVVLRLPPC